MNVITTENVFEAFDEAAPRYDLMVALNPGYHRHLRSAADSLVEAMSSNTWWCRWRRTHRIAMH